jgi:hypothetical protein
LAVLAA